LGENGAGKTTLMKILSGYSLRDGGEIYLDDRPETFQSPAEAIAAGIGMLHQDPLDVPALNVLDNFMLGQRGGILQDRRHSARQLAILCQRFGFSLDADAQADSLTVGERQQLELVRLLALGVRVVILDEPTTGISEPQKHLLFQTLRELAREGLTVIFVSHKLADIEVLCERATVLRRGQVVGTATTPFSTDHLVEMMFGQCLTSLPRAPIDAGEAILELRDVAIRTYRLDVENVSLSIRRGEVIGLAGLEGSGQRVFMEACAGIHRIASGQIVLDGRDMSHQSYRRFLQAGVGFVPAARLEEGMIGGFQIREHVALGQNDHRFFVPWNRADIAAQRMIDAYHIVGRPETRVAELSGGNQQRALLALLPPDLSVILLEHPTRGLDVGSSQWVWSRLHERRQRGTAILFTSTDLDELVEHSDRIVVFSSGVASEPVDAARVTCEELGYLIGGKRWRAPEAGGQIL
jgi:simple sugar transport system ATP-binding protein